MAKEKGKSFKALKYVDYQNQRKRLATRADFSPANGRPLVVAADQERLTYFEKMDRYREKILAQFNVVPDADVKVAREIGKTLFHKLDYRSIDKIRSEEENTAIAVYSDLLNYLRLLHEYDIRAFPVNDSAIEFYLDYLTGLEKPAAKATIDRKIASLAKWHQWLELDDFRKTYRAADRIKRARKKVRAPQHQAEGLRAEDLTRAQNIFNPALLRDSADMALLFTGFYTMCRRSELVSFEWSDLKINSRDNTGTLFLASSKTDKEGEGQYLFVSSLTVGILQHWKNVSGQRGGKIFRSVYSNGSIGEFLSEKGVERAYKRIARRLGLSFLDFSGHSARVGAAKEMVYRNLPTAKIMLAGRWASERMVVRYARELEAQQGAAADLAGMLENPELQTEGSHFLYGTNTSLLHDENDVRGK